MISVIIPTRETDHLLIPALASLVPGAAAGVVRQVFLVDAGDPATSRIAGVADAAGCDYLNGPGDMGARLRQGAETATSPWLMFLSASGLLQEGWARETHGFIDQTERNGAAAKQAATFRLALDGFGLKPRLKESAGVISHALFGYARAEQGLLIHRQLYQALGGHETGANAARRLMGKVGRSRLILLRSQILLPQSLPPHTHP